MAPKRKASGSKGSRPKRARVVLTLRDKVKIIEMREKGESFVSIARAFGKNESSIREVYKARDKIKSSAAVLPEASKVTTVTRDKVIEKMERALFLWLQDMTKKNQPPDSRLLKQKALSLHKQLCAGDTRGVPRKPFLASNGWLNRFKNRFSLKNYKLSGEAASADEEAASVFPARLKKIIEEGGYDPRQVFNCDETGLFWKKMPNRTFIHKSVRSVPGKKAFKDKLTLLLCGNAAGQMITPTVIYKSQNPRALKNKNKSSLPVFWMSNKKAGVTVDLFLEWVRRCFIPEARELMQKEGLPFKVLLLMDDAPGHPKTICTENEDVQIVFLPPNTSALLQPLDQGIIRCVQASYTKQVFEMIRASIEIDPESDVLECYKNFNIADAIVFIRAAQDELKAETGNACWKKAWPEAVKDFEGFPRIDADVNKILRLARMVGGDGMKDLTESDVIKHLEEHRTPLTDEELEELVRSSPEDEDDGDDEETQESLDWNLDNLKEILQGVKAITTKIHDIDPKLDRSSRIRRAMLDSVAPLQELYHQLRAQKSQLEITPFLKPVPKSTEPRASTSCVIAPQPSTSLATSEEFPRPTDVETMLINESGSDWHLDETNKNSHANNHPGKLQVKEEGDYIVKEEHDISDEEYNYSDVDERLIKSDVDLQGMYCDVKEENIQNELNDFVKGEHDIDYEDMV